MEKLAVMSNVKKRIDEFELGPLNLTIEPGTITTLIGNNGSGKSTVLKLMMDLAKADNGNIKILGAHVGDKDESWKSSISYQPQTVVGWNTFTGKTLKNFIAPLYPDWDDRKFEEMTKSLKIPLNKRFGKLSQGVRQKLNLALTIPRNTPILLLDEPTASLDIPSRKIIIDLLTEWMEQDERAIVMTSHQSEDILKLADYLSVLQSGNLLGTYEKETLKESYMRYWMKNETPDTLVPGEAAREGQMIISKDPAATEKYFAENNFLFTSATKLDLDEIITILLS
ncbi:ATP-binding cassette domain-containing protein [Virgibacillus oceani]